MKRDLSQVLCDEAEALIQGRYDKLKALSEERELLIARLPEDQLGDAEHIRTLAARNMRLAEAAARGLAVARDRAEKIVKGASLDTYAQDGKRQTYRDNRPKLHRRA